MTAVRWHARGDVRIEEVPAPPPPGPGEVQVRVLACGICGTDVEEYRSGPQFLDGDRAPLTLGHELAGRVVAVGPGVLAPTVGDLVAVAPDMTCGKCHWCTEGRPNLCAELRSLGFAADGGLAQLCNCDAALAVVLPPHLSPEEGALVETAAVAVAALRRGRLAAGERVAVIGGGAVGLLAAQAAAAFGAAEVTVIEPLASRRGLACLQGARALAPEDAHEVEADVVLECSGAPSGFTTAVERAAGGGRVVVVGIHERPVSLDAVAVVARELEIVGSLSYRFAPDYVDAVRMMSEGVLRAGLLVSSRIPVGDAVHRGLLALAAQPEDHVKIMVMP